MEKEELQKKVECVTHISRIVFLEKVDYMEHISEILRLKNENFSLFLGLYCQLNQEQSLEESWKHPLFHKVVLGHGEHLPAIPYIKCAINKA